MRKKSEPNTNKNIGSKIQMHMGAFLHTRRFTNQAIHQTAHLQPFEFSMVLSQTSFHGGIRPSKRDQNGKKERIKGEKGSGIRTWVK